MKDCCKRKYYRMHIKYGNITIFECPRCKETHRLNNEEKKELNKHEPKPYYPTKRKRPNAEVIGCW